MGVYDTFISVDGKTSVQLKNGLCCLETYKEGDYINDDPAFRDGIYVAPEGFVVIERGTVMAVTESREDLSQFKTLPVFSKWGDEISLDDDIEERSPIAQALKDVAEEFEK